MADTTPAIYKAIIGVMAEINAIGKDRKNQQQGFAYRGIDDVMNELHAALTKNKVFVVPEVLNEERSTGKTRSGGDLFYTRLKIRFTFYTDDGSSVSAVVIGEAMDSGDKASNKALSIGLKYAMLQVFCIPTEDEKDPDAQSPQPQAGSMKPAKPAPKKAAFDFTPKGGETTPAEKKELGEIFKATFPDGSPVFSKEAMKFFSDLRKDFTAREVIEKARAERDKRLNPTSTMSKASELPKAVEDVKEAFNGEVVQAPKFDDMAPVEPTPAEPTGEKSGEGFEIY
jgi:hypothetical protein